MMIDSKKGGMLQIVLVGLMCVVSAIAIPVFATTNTFSELSDAVGLASGAADNAVTKGPWWLVAMLLVLSLGSFVAFAWMGGRYMINKITCLEEKVFNSLSTGSDKYAALALTMQKSVDSNTAAMNGCLDQQKRFANGHNTGSG